jgi:hypothetical protein
MSPEAEALFGRLRTLEEHVETLSRRLETFEARAADTERETQAGLRVVDQQIAGLMTRPSAWHWVRLALEWMLVAVIGVPVLGGLIYVAALFAADLRHFLNGLAVPYWIRWLWASLVGPAILLSGVLVMVWMMIAGPLWRRIIRPFWQGLTSSDTTPSTSHEK